MGYRIESYSLSELHRISMPGTITPSLFWALPIGNWQDNVLEEVWRLFTESESECRDYGMLLVKDTPSSQDEKTKVDLSLLKANLAELVPCGSERFAPSPYENNSSQRMLVLSGGYPQPGWGLLFELRREPSQAIEELIRRTVSKLCEDNSKDLTIFKEATQSLERLNRARIKPERKNISPLENEIRVVEKVLDGVCHAQEALTNCHFSNVYENLNAIVQVLGQDCCYDNYRELVNPLLDTSLKLQKAFFVMSVSQNVFKDEIESNLRLICTNPHARKSVFKNLSNDEVKHALSACLYLKSNDILELDQDFYSWAEQNLSEIPTTLSSKLTDLKSNITNNLESLLGRREMVNQEYIAAFIQWKRNLCDAQETFQRMMGRVAEFQWELGPRFLVVMEDVCRQTGLQADSIPWDPPRMIGWKIMVSQISLKLLDLQSVAKKFTDSILENLSENGDVMEEVDGSYFTDYVHYIAVSKPGFSPRAVTRDLIANLLRPAEMTNLINLYGGANVEDVNDLQLAEELLHTFGWQQSDEMSRKSLAGCIKAGDDSSPTLTEDVNGNGLRIVLESFCKDIIDVIVTKLAYSQDEVWDSIEGRCSEYKPSSMKKDWEEEVQKMTLGSAKIVLGALAQTAFPEKQTEVTEFLNVLGKLTPLVNRLSHDFGDRESENLFEIPVLVHELLEKAQGFLGELPWHMNASYVYGEQPKVLSGEAWSHSSASPRFMRVIVWQGNSPDTKVVFWNKTRRNPVVADPVFIRRPSRR